MSEEERRICIGVSDKQLDTRVSDYHIAEIANDLVEWEVVAPYFNLTESDQMEIMKDYEGRYNLQKRKALHVWRWKSGDKATYRTLISICCSQRLINLAERVVMHLVSGLRPPSSRILDSFFHYLMDCYLKLSHPCREQWPTKGPLKAPTKFFDLILHEAPLTEVQYSSTSRLLSHDSRLLSHDSRLLSHDNFKSVTLTSTLTKSEESHRMLVYFEGIAGSGKTTLMWHACREWAEKSLLRQFYLLIHVQLNNPEVHSASCLPDIIPYPDKMFRQEVATAIADRKGKDVCFLLDGLDEAPTKLLDFLLVGLIQGKLGSLQLPELSFVMTSRPDVRVMKRLNPEFFSSRILISGFSKTSLHEFFEDFDSRGKEKIREELRINPRLEGLCSHPINAVILSYLARFIDNNLPTTQTNLYKPLVSNFLVRHMDTRLKKEEPCVISNLLDDECIPLEICQMFKKICSLAYCSILETKRLFSLKELGQADLDLDDNLGFLHVYPRMTMFGSERYFSFSHLSLQEFLAAIHLSKMKVSQQICAVEKFLKKSPQSQVLSFYAGVTRLSNRRVMKVISGVFSQTVESEAIVEYLLHETINPQQKALALLNCIFESQNELLLKESETDLPLNKRVHEGVDGVYKAAGLQKHAQQPLHSLSLHFLALSPLDCLSLGYYINGKSTSMSNSPVMSFDLAGCSIDHIGMQLLFVEMKKQITHRTNVRVQLMLHDNKFSQDSVFLLKELVRGQSNVENLGLCNCFDPSIVTLSYVLKCLVEGLSDNSSCTFIKSF